MSRLNSFCLAFKRLQNILLMLSDELSKKLFGQLQIHYVIHRLTNIKLLGIV